MFDIILYQPEIPPNSGNIMRLAANTGSKLHLVRPLGFRLDERSLVRAGLDYREHTEVEVHADWESCSAALGARRLFAVSTRGGTRYDVPAYSQGDAFLFGPETRGLPDTLLGSVPERRRLRIPMGHTSRSINLANAVAIVLYEAWRQNGFAGGR
jgi:tRNA (cytidine/uridine-2'-O-)-methyltransferase